MTLISNPRTQEAIICLVLIFGVVSAFSMANTTSYYTGTVYMIRYLEPTLQEIRISDMDLENHSQTFFMRLIFNFKIPDVPNGTARLTTIGAVVYLNGQQLSYASFYRNINYESGILTPNFNKNFTLVSPLEILSDRHKVYNASIDEQWEFSIVFRYFYRTFASRADEVSRKVFNASESLLRII